MLARHWVQLVLELTRLVQQETTKIKCFFCAATDLVSTHVCICIFIKTTYFQKSSLPSFGLSLFELTQLVQQKITRIKFFFTVTAFANNYLRISMSIKTNSFQKRSLQIIGYSLCLDSRDWSSRK